MIYISQILIFPRYLLILGGSKFNVVNCRVMLIIKQCKYTYKYIFLYEVLCANILCKDNSEKYYSLIIIKMSHVDQTACKSKSSLGVQKERGVGDACLCDENKSGFNSRSVYVGKINFHGFRGHCLEFIVPIGVVRNKRSTFVTFIYIILLPLNKYYYEVVKYNEYYLLSLVCLKD